MGDESSPSWAAVHALFVRKKTERDMNTTEKLKNNVYSFNELDTIGQNAIQLRDAETLSLIQLSRASKLTKGEKPKPVAGDWRP